MLFDLNIVVTMTNTPIVPGAMTQTDSTGPNRSATWPQIKDFAWTRQASSLAHSAYTQEELEGYSVSSCLVRSASSSCQSMAYWDYAEEPGGGALELDTAPSWVPQAQGSSELCINNRNVSGAQARVPVDARRASADTPSVLQLGTARKNQLHGLSRSQSHELGRRSSRGTKRMSPVNLEAVKKPPEHASGDKGFHKRRKIEDSIKDDEDDASYQEKLYTDSCDDINLFACPFYRRFPIRHKDCMNRKLTRIRDVKQHIMRRHIQAAFYCPTCYESYPSSRLRDKHIQSRCCEARPPPILDNLDSSSKEVQDLVSYRANNSSTQEEKWHEIWRLLFREDSGGKNAFLGTLTEETIGIIREFWEQKSYQILPAYLASRGIEDDLGAGINSLFIDLLGEVQVGLKQWTTRQPDKVMDGDNWDSASHTERSLSKESTIHIPPRVNLTPERIDPRFVTPMVPMSSTTAPIILPDELPSSDAEAFVFEGSTTFSASMQETAWSWLKLDDYSSPKYPETLSLTGIL